MEIAVGTGAECFTIRNILLGPVWICSGQSNMGMTTLSVKDTYPDDIALAGTTPSGSFRSPHSGRCQATDALEDKAYTQERPGQSNEGGGHSRTHL